MKAIFQKIEANINHSFNVEHMKFQYLQHSILFHPNIEILLVIRGTGTRFIGDSRSTWFRRTGIVGQNVPHGWQSVEK